MLFNSMIHEKPYHNLNIRETIRSLLQLLTIVKNRKYPSLAEECVARFARTQPSGKGRSEGVALYLTSTIQALHGCLQLMS